MIKCLCDTEKCIVYEPISGKFIESTILELKYNIQSFNYLRSVLNKSKVSFNMWLSQLGIPRTEVGDYLCWYSWDDIGELWIDLEGYMECDGKPMVVIVYGTLPGHIFE